MGKKARRYDDIQLIIDNEEAKMETTQKLNKKYFHIRDLRPIQPLTENQKRFFKAHFQQYNTLLMGYAGTGKTFLGMYAGLSDVLNESSPYKKLMIVRSNVATRDMGHLPGTEKEKMQVYELPYQAICDELFEFSKSYENLKKSGYVEFISTSFVRGLTMNDAVILVDECENLTFHELDSIITRVGNNSKIIFCGDIRQTDLIKNRYDQTGMKEFVNVINKMTDDFYVIDFTDKDIVRSGLVRNYILAKTED